MEVQQKEQVATVLELMSQMNYFSKLKPDSENDNLLSTPVKASSYCELSLMISSLLKSSIGLLKQDDPTEKAIDLIILLEIALDLLPNDEMDLLDKLYQMNKK